MTDERKVPPDWCEKPLEQVVLRPDESVSVRPDEPVVHDGNEEWKFHLKERKGFQW